MNPKLETKLSLLHNIEMLKKMQEIQRESEGFHDEFISTQS